MGYFLFTIMQVEARISILHLFHLLTNIVVGKQVYIIHVYERSSMPRNMCKLHKTIICLSQIIRHAATLQHGQAENLQLLLSTRSTSSAIKLANWL